MGKRYLADVLETMGAYVDSLKFAGGSFVLMPRTAVKELIDLAHQHEVLVSTGGVMERGVARGGQAGGKYLPEGRGIGIGIVRHSGGIFYDFPRFLVPLGVKNRRQG